jgi:hypothetical protein
MSDRSFKRGARVLSAVATMLLGIGCGNSDDEKTGEKADAIKCFGANECAGMSECAGGPSGSECKGLNECKAMGWDYTDTKDECEKLGGMPQA